MPIVWTAALCVSHHVQSRGRDLKKVQLVDSLSIPVDKLPWAWMPVSNLS